MNRILKYPIIPTDLFEIEMPEYARILCVQVQKTRPMIWALVDESRPMELRRFYLRGTGHPFPEADHAEYVGTFQMIEEGLVFHLFVDCKKR